MTGIRLKEYTERSDGLAKVHLDLDVANKNEARLIAGKLLTASIEPADSEPRDT